MKINMNDNYGVQNNNEFNYFNSGDVSAYPLSQISEQKPLFRSSYTIIFNILAIVADIITVALAVRDANIYGIGAFVLDSIAIKYILVVGILLIITLFLLKFNYEIITKKWCSGFIEKDKMLFKVKPNKCNRCGASMKLDEGCKYVCKRNPKHKVPFDFTK